MTPEQMMETLPYLWQETRQVRHHGADAQHPRPWRELVLACGHTREHGRTQAVPLRVRCYECGRRYLRGGEK